MNSSESQPIAKQIGELLAANNFRADDPATVEALAAVLVSACVSGHVSKKNFFQVLRDMWRRSIIARDSLEQGLTEAQQQPSLETKAEASAEAEVKNV